jgi:hypothetical protein
MTPDYPSLFAMTHKVKHLVFLCCAVLMLSFWSTFESVALDVTSVQALFSDSWSKLQECCRLVAWSKSVFCVSLAYMICTRPGSSLALH